MTLSFNLIFMCLQPMVHVRNSEELAGRWVSKRLAAAKAARRVKEATPLIMRPFHRCASPAVGADSCVCCFRGLARLFPFNHEGAAAELEGGEAARATRPAAL